MKGGIRIRYAVFLCPEDEQAVGVSSNDSVLNGQDTLERVATDLLATRMSREQYAHARCASGLAAWQLRDLCASRLCILDPTSAARPVFDATTEMYSDGN